MTLKQNENSIRKKTPCVYDQKNAIKITENVVTKNCIYDRKNAKYVIKIAEKRPNKVMHL